MIKLNDGHQIPQLGYGMWQIPDEETENAVLKAIEIGYRSIDCAQIYQNEAGLGRAIQKFGKRDELFITTKIWNANQGRDLTLSSFDVSMNKLGLEQLDLLLIHWPKASQGLFVETWKTLIELKKSTRVRSIGVSNFTVSNLKTILDATGEVPVINQIEVHPHFQQREIRKFHEGVGIKTESWSPLGQGSVLKDPVIQAIADKHRKTAAQVIIRWHLDEGLIAIPKSVNPTRMKENFSVFDFTLDPQDHKQIEGLDNPKGRVGPDPDTATF